MTEPVPADQCTHPIEARSVLRDGRTVYCIACQTRRPADEWDEPATEAATEVVAATSLPAAVRMSDAALAAGWTAQLDTEGSTIVLNLERGPERGRVAWKRNDEGAWRFDNALIGGQRFGARAVADRLNKPYVDPLSALPSTPAGPVETSATVTPIRPEPTDATMLAPAPPSTPAAVMPMGTLVSFMAAAPKPLAANGNTDWATRYAAELRRVIHDAGRNSARNLQIHLGPSELGATCDRQVAGKFAGIPATNHVADPWPSILGTAGHAWLAEAFKAENARHGLRWVPENRVTPHPDHAGTADLYDGQEQAVVDWKILGADSLDKIVANGPSVQYQIQLLLYGLGYRKLGLPVRRVVLVALPRTKSTLDDMYVWDHELTPADDATIDELFKLTAIRKQWADEIRAGRIGLLNVPATPSADACYFCPFYRPQAGHDGGIGCPGTAQ